MIAWLRQEYESIFEDGSGKMTVSRGKLHTYLGMTLDFPVDGVVIVSMFDYINEIIAAFDKADDAKPRQKASAAPEDLFKIDTDCEKLDATKDKTLYPTKRARPDTGTAIAAYVIN